MRIASAKEKLSFISFSLRWLYRKQLSDTENWAISKSDNVKSFMGRQGKAMTSLMVSNSPDKNPLLP
jgi:hypothetical protein